MFFLSYFVFLNLFCNTDYWFDIIKENKDWLTKLDDELDDLDDFDNSGDVCNRVFVGSATHHQLHDDPGSGDDLAGQSRSHGHHVNDSNHHTDDHFDLGASG